MLNAHGQKLMVLALFVCAGQAWGMDKKQEPQINQILCAGQPYTMNNNKKFVSDKKLTLFLSNKLKNTLKTQNTLITELNEKLTEKDTKIYKLNEKLTKQNTEINDLNEIVTKKKEFTNMENNHLTKEDLENIQAKEAISNLKSSNTELKYIAAEIAVFSVASIIAVDCMESQVIKKTLRSWYKSIKRLIHQCPAKKQSGSAHPASKQH